jgi:hypothetical protein
VDEQLQQVVLYGIAMADTPQQQQQHSSTSSHQQADGSVPAPSAAEAQPAAEAAVHPGGSSSFGRTLLTAAEGQAALQLYSSSLGRYGGAGAFMAPCYGSGSLPEAFVRLAAVKGAATALRHGAVQLELLPPQQQQQQQGDAQQPANEVAGVSSSEQPSRLNSEAAGDTKQPCEGNTESDFTGTSPAAAAAEVTAGACDKAALAAAAAAAKVRVVLASGQCLTADAVVAWTATAQGNSPAAECSRQPAGSLVASTDAAPHLHQQQQQQQRVASAVALLDGSVVDGESSLLLVFPPSSLGSKQTAVIRGLQLGPAFGVAPPGKYLLYLSAVLSFSCSTDTISSSSSSSGSAEQVLGHALQALAAGKGLQAFQYADEEQQEDVQQAAGSSGEHARMPAAGAATDGDASVSEDSSSRQQVQEDTEQQQQVVAASLLPQVLAVCYFTCPQPTQQFYSQASPAAAQQGSSSSRSSNGTQDSAVVWCPAAAQGFMGYTQTINAAEAAYRQQFPGLPWLTDAAPSAQPAAAAGAVDAAGGASATAAGDQAGDGGGAAGGGGVLDDGELDAIDELTAALLELSAPPKLQ